MSDLIRVSHWLERVRESRPLVHNITNMVVTNVVANALLAIGASPVMAYAEEEVAEMARIASALALNMGTLDSRVVQSMLIAGQSAGEARVPIVFDPVGVGATRFRNETADLVVNQLNLSVLRGNQGEIGFMLGSGGEVKGVDSVSAGGSLVAVMKAWATSHQCVVVATGEVDYITDGNRVLALSNGHPIMAAITGSGCQATGLLGAFCGVAGRNASLADLADACAAALTCFNVAGELAAVEVKGPGTFQAALFDALYHLDGPTVDTRARIGLVEV